jgi:hypothetical protein
LNQGTLSPAPLAPKPSALGTPTEVSQPNGQIDISRVESSPLPSTSVPYEPPFTLPRWHWAPDAVPADPSSQPHGPGEEWKPVAVRVLTKLQTSAAGPTLKKADLPAVKKAILDALDPAVTIGQALLKRLRLDRKMAHWNPKDPIEPIMAAPDFPQPMYEGLRDLSKDWVFPGLEKVPPNTVSLLLANDKFIESYMGGLSYEMARALLFNDYPTDQRGTYFRQFWDVRGVLGGATEEHKDIKPIHMWAKSAQLGENSPRPAGDHLVLLVRGELLQRYPNTIIYAARAVADGDTRKPSIDAKDEKYPIFLGSMSHDVTFVGFDLSIDDAKGSETDPGWFFVLQEQPKEPRFGLDEAEHAVATDAARCSDLSWGHFVKTDDELKGLVYLNFGGELPKVTDPGAAKWPDPRASDIAYATLRRPTRVAIHADEML